MVLDPWSVEPNHAEDHIASLYIGYLCPYVQVQLKSTKIAAKPCRIEPHTAASMVTERTFWRQCDPLHDLAQLTKDLEPLSMPHTPKTLMHWI